MGSLMPSEQGQGTEDELMSDSDDLHDLQKIIMPKLFLRSQHLCVEMRPLTGASWSRPGVEAVDVAEWLLVFCEI
jgi:hypothetical protein